MKAFSGEESQGVAKRPFDKEVSMDRVEPEAIHKDHGAVTTKGE